MASVSAGGSTGTYRFEAPIVIDNPILVDPAMGICKVALRRRKRPRRRSLSLFDTPDERLMRAGVELGHLVHGHGKARSARWILRAAGWQPYLPEEQIYAEEDGLDLPLELVAATLPFRRRTPLLPSAEWQRYRTRYDLLDAAGEPIGNLTDDRISVRRSGPAMLRLRQLTFRPGHQMTPRQRQFVIARLVATGCVRVDRFDDPWQRLQPILPVFERDRYRTGKHANIEEFTRAELGRSYARLLSAHLPNATATEQETDEELAHLDRSLIGLETVLDEEWLSRMRESIALTRELGQNPPGGVLSAGWTTLLDDLMLASRVPPLSVDGRLPAARILLDEHLNAVAEIVLGLDTIDSTDDEAWRALAAEAQTQAARAAVLAGLVNKGPAWARSLQRLAARLAETVNPVPAPDEHDIELLSPQAAFAIGRRHEAGALGVREQRLGVLASWPSLRAKLLRRAPQTNRFATMLMPALAASTEPQLGEPTDQEQA